MQCEEGGRQQSYGECDDLLACMATKTQIRTAPRRASKRLGMVTCPLGRHLGTHTRDRIPTPAVSGSSSRCTLSRSCKVWPQVFCNVQVHLADGGEVAGATLQPYMLEVSVHPFLLHEAWGLRTIRVSCCRVQKQIVCGQASRVVGERPHGERTLCPQQEGVNW